MWLSQTSYHKLTPHACTHTHFTARLDFVQDYPGDLAPER